MTGTLVLMGSGETAPTMIKVHRAIFERVGGAPAVLLDTPYGFQENADDISKRAVGYFAESVGRRVDVVGWRSPPPPGVARERALAAISDAGWLFAGPGSPTYALRQWRDTPIPDALADTVRRGAVVLFASAAALTLGSHTVPVYEIYKAGETPHWAEGMDLVRATTGLPAVVIPHYDNAEGGHHDTRFCYLGERRLSTLERELPEDAFVLGVDEHTAVLLDLATRTACVLGNGTMTIRRDGVSVKHASGTVLGFDDLGSTEGSTATAPRPVAPSIVDASDPTNSLRGSTEEATARFDAALAARDVDGCVGAVLDLEQALHDWSSDTLTSDEGNQARTALRRMVMRLGELAVAGARDPRQTLSPYVEALLELRRRARDGRDYATSDWIRDRLTDAGVEVRDTPEGAQWSPPGEH